MKTPGQKLSEARESLGLTQDEVAEALGISRATISQWEHDVTRPRGHRLASLAKLFQVSDDVLEKWGFTDPKNVGLKLANISRIPLVEWPELQGFLADDPKIRSECKYVARASSDLGEFAVEMNDNSMAPDDPLLGIAAGERLIVSASLDPRPEDIVLGEMLTTGEIAYVIRDYRPRVGGIFDLVPRSPEFETYSSRGRQTIYIKGVVVEHHRKLRRK